VTAEDRRAVELVLDLLRTIRTADDELEGSPRALFVKIAAAAVAHLGLETFEQDWLRLEEDLDA
jgi:hypothetical protein